MGCVWNNIFRVTWVVLEWSFQNTWQENSIYLGREIRISCHLYYVSALGFKRMVLTSESLQTWWGKGTAAKGVQVLGQILPWRSFCAVSGISLGINPGSFHFLYYRLAKKKLEHSPKYSSFASLPVVGMEKVHGVVK